MQIVGNRSENIDLEEFLARPLFAHLATASEYGPRGSPVWFLWEEDALWIIAVLDENTFQERIRQDPRCTVSIVDFDCETGLVQHIGSRGRATLEPWDFNKAKRLLARYLGDDETDWDRGRFLENLDDPDIHSFVKLEPETAVVRDQSYNPSSK
ncbi:hypothetical protein BH24ACT22_BH24ACT22_19910 [soil metagenome]